MVTYPQVANRLLIFESQMTRNEINVYFKVYNEVSRLVIVFLTGSSFDTDIFDTL